MKRNALFILLLFSAFNIWAIDVPDLLILSTTSGEVQIPISTIQKITYDKNATTMYVYTNSCTNTYSVADISQMTLGNSSTTTKLDNTSFPLGADQGEVTKFTKDGVVYVIKDGKIYTMKGEPK